MMSLSWKIKFFVIFIITAMIAVSLWSHVGPQTAAFNAIIWIVFGIVCFVISATIASLSNPRSKTELLLLVLRAIVSRSGEAGLSEKYLVRQDEQQYLELPPSKLKKMLPKHKLTPNVSRIIDQSVSESTVEFSKEKIRLLLPDILNVINALYDELMKIEGYGTS